jgi:hypothetical protein
VQVEQNLSGGNSKPVIVANTLVCKELCKLEEEIEAATLCAAEMAEREGLESDDILICSEVARAVVEEDVACFLHELGWYFQNRSYWQFSNSASLDMVGNFISWFMSLMPLANRAGMLALNLELPIWIEICVYSLLIPTTGRLRDEWL